MSKSDTEIDANQAIEIVKNITGRDGLVKVVADLTQRESVIKAQTNMLAGELASIVRMRKMLINLSTKWGLDDVVVDQNNQSDNKEVIKILTQTDIEGSSPVDEDTTRRQKEGLCLFKARKSKNWCSRKLRSKLDKETGYCSKCRTLLAG